MNRMNSPNQLRIKNRPHLAVDEGVGDERVAATSQSGVRNQGIKNGCMRGGSGALMKSGKDLPRVGGLRLIIHVTNQ